MTDQQTTEAGQHTQGPWKVLDGSILCEQVNAYGNFHIASFDRGDHQLTDEDEANARLIAAAPGLLAACRIILDAADFNGNLRGNEQAIIAAARAAIASTEA